MAKGRATMVSDARRPAPRAQYAQPTPQARRAAPARSAAAPAPRKRRARRKPRGAGLRRLLYILAAALLLAAIGVVLWHTLLPASADSTSQTSQTPEAHAAAEPTSTAAAETNVNAIVVAVDPGHGGVNPNIGAEDYGSEHGGLRESEITLSIAQLLYDKLQADERFAPVMTADGSTYLKPSQRGAVAKQAGAQLLVSVHLNYDSTLTASGFECYAATPNLATNADSVRFGTLLTTAFGNLGLSIRGDNGVRYLYYGDNDERIVTESYDTTPRSDATFTVLEACGCPAVLCEMGFITSSGDMAILNGANGNEAAAEALYQSILQYFSLS